MRPHLSKSRFVIGHQCHRRLWLEVHDRNAPELVRSVAGQATLEHGKQVGDVARGFFPGGILIEVPHTEPRRRVEETRAAIQAGANVIYEASFFEDDIFVAVDILHRNGSGWTLTEVKSTTKVKPEHLVDAAVQTHVLRRAGLPVERTEIMHLDRACTYPDLSNLFWREDVTEEVEALLPAIPFEARRQLGVLEGPHPDVAPGDHCFAPYECPFTSRCIPPAPDNHIANLYRLHRARVADLVGQGYGTIDALPDELVLNAVAERQRRAIREGRMIVEPGLRAALDVLAGPVAFLDFETLNLPISLWPGCHPYEPGLAVQFSVHHENGEHHEWIADGLQDPRERLAVALIEATRGTRTVAAYNSPFEKRCVEHLRDHLPHLAGQLDEIIRRLVDVLPVVRNHVYHPGFNGSFSLKSVCPVLLGRDGYRDLEVADGGTASWELERVLFDATMAGKERARIRTLLLRYCAMDTAALMEVVTQLRNLVCS